MESLRKMSKAQPHLPWLVGSVLVSLIILVVMMSVAMGEAPQVKPPPLLASDWVLILAGGLTVPATMFMYWLLQHLPQPPARAKEQVKEMQIPQSQRHIILNNPHARPEVVLRLTQERDEWKRLHDELQRKYAQAKQTIVPMVVEPERELTYRAVAALLKSGNVGIKAAIEIVRVNGGTVGRRGYAELQALLPLLPPCPAAQDTPDSHTSQAVNREPEREPGTVNPVNQGRRARLPRKRRGW